MLSALYFSDRIVCYELVDGEYQVRELGLEPLLDLTDDMRAAIAADIEHQAQKARADLQL